MLDTAVLVVCYTVSCHRQQAVNQTGKNKQTQPYIVSNGNSIFIAKIITIIKIIKIMLKKLRNYATFSCCFKTTYGEILSLFSFRLLFSFDILY